MKTITINSINGGVHVTFTHDDDTTHEEHLSGASIPYHDAASLTQYLIDYAAAWEAGKEIESHELSQPVAQLAGQTINLN